MKYTLHIPVEQYGFVEAELESMFVEDEPTVKEVYDGIKNLFLGGNGISDKDYDTFLDCLLMGDGNNVELYENMSDIQRLYIQKIKRALKRIEAKNK